MRAANHGLQKSMRAAVASAAKQFAGELIEAAKSTPRALKREHSFNDLNGTSQLVLFLSVEESEFFSKRQSRHEDL
jgi:hypothetical protein